MFSTVGDIMINEEVILSPMGDTQYHEDTLPTWGDIMSIMGKIFFVICVPHGSEHPHGTHDTRHVHHDIHHGTEYPPQYSRYPTTVLMITLTVMNTPRHSRHPHIYHDFPHGTQDIPHMHHDIPHGTAPTLYRVIKENQVGALLCKDKWIHLRVLISFSENYH